MHDKYTISIAATNISTYIHQNTIIKKSLWQYDVIFFSINEQIALHLIMPFELSSFGGESKSFSLNLEMHRAKYDAPGFWSVSSRKQCLTSTLALGFPMRIVTCT